MMLRDAICLPELHHSQRIQVPDPEATLLSVSYVTMSVSIVPHPVYLNFLPALYCKTRKHMPDEKLPACCV